MPAHIQFAADLLRFQFFSEGEGSASRSILTLSGQPFQGTIVCNNTFGYPGVESQ